MRLFRDLGRYKAYKRRHATSQKQYALMSILLHQDDPLQDFLRNDASGEQEDESNLPTYTLEELYELGNGSLTKPLSDQNDNDEEEETPQLLISIYGRVYDVSLGSKFYGPDGPYSLFAGHDITYALSTGCRTTDCVNQLDYATSLTTKDQEEGKRWLSFFHLHDKYPLVGKLEDGENGNHFQTLLNQLLQEVEQEQQQSDSENKPKMPPIMMMN